MWVWSVGGSTCACSRGSVQEPAREHSHPSSRPPTRRRAAPLRSPALQVWQVVRAKGQKIASGGTLIIGREQDCEGGCFDSAIGGPCIRAGTRWAGVPHRCTCAAAAALLPAAARCPAATRGPCLCPGMPQRPPAIAHCQRPCTSHSCLEAPLLFPILLWLLQARRAARRRPPSRSTVPRRVLFADASQGVWQRMPTALAGSAKCWQAWPPSYFSMLPPLPSMPGFLRFD